MKSVSALSTIIDKRKSDHKELTIKKFYIFILCKITNYVKFIKYKILYCCKNKWKSNVGSERKFVVFFNRSAVVDDDQIVTPIENKPLHTTRDMVEILYTYLSTFVHISRYEYLNLSLLSLKKRYKNFSFNPIVNNISKITYS